MKYETAAILITLFGFTKAAPLVEREVPQEHSHEKFLVSVDESLKLDNPDNILNPVFGLLGDQAAKTGAGKITNLDCLHRAIADRAFTNAKNANNIEGMANALIYAALEKNTGAVGKASNTCNDPAVNPEINAISQHQDPAGPGAQESNKQIVLTLAVQLSLIGADPQLAAQSATFAPGKLDDPTAAGNTCDDQDDKIGCIFTKKLIQVEATPDEIDAAVKAAGGKAGNSAKATGNDKSNDSTAEKNESKAQGAGDNGSKSKAASIDDGEKITAAAAEDNSAGNNVQTFTGSLGGAPPPVTETAGSDRPFSVKGDTFVRKGAALQRSCAVQHNACASEANSGGSFSVSDCDAQENECNKAAQGNAKRTVSKRASKRSNKRNSKRSSKRASKRANKRSISKRAVVKPGNKSAEKRAVVKPGN